MKLRITSRENRAALWIGEKNIWDIDNKHVCADVLKAIRNAYDIGYKRAIDDVMAVPPNFLGMFAVWEDERNGK